MAERQIISLVQILRLSFLLLACIFIILPRLCSGKRTVRETCYSRWNVLFAVPRFCDIHIDSAHAAVFQQVFQHQCSVLLLRKQCYFKTVLMDYLLLVNFGAVGLILVSSHHFRLPRIVLHCTNNYKKVLCKHTYSFNETKIETEI